MNTPTPTRTTLRIVGLPLALGWAMVHLASAQQVLVSPPANPLIDEQQTAGTETNEVPSSIFAPAPAALPRETQPFQWGPVTLHPHLNYQFLYGNGLQSGPGQSHRSIVQTVSPGATFELGRLWQLDYTPSAMFYSDSHFRNVVDHSVALGGRASYEDWRFGLGQTAIISTDPSVQTAQQTKQQLYSTSLSAGYQINSEVSLDLGAAQNIQILNGQNFQNSYDWSTMDWLNFQWAPNLGASVGAGAGYSTTEATTNSQVGSDMVYEQAQARVAWRVVHKVNLSIHGGVETMQFNSSQADLITPIFGMAIQYQPFEVTSLSLAADRTVANSYYLNQVTEVTSLTATLNQRLLSRLYLNISGQYGNTVYRTSSQQAFPFTPLGTRREDNFDLFSVGLSTAFLKRGTASVSYSKSHNASNIPGFGYSSDQIMLQLAYRY